MTARCVLAVALVPLSVLCVSAGSTAVLVGLSNRQCNAQRTRNLDGKVLLAGDKNLLDSPGACCAACKLRSDCNIWTSCTVPEGCDAGGRYHECTLKQDWNVFKYQKVISTGSNWVSGFIGDRCPGTDANKLLALQRISFPSLASQCQPGSSCTTCMCQLSHTMQVAQSDPHDLSLCIHNFRTVMQFPQELGGASLSAAAYQRLTQCPVSDPPCADQQSAVVFGTLGPAVVPANAGQELACYSDKSEGDCAAACVATASCAAFLYTVQQGTSASGRCCLKSSVGWDSLQLSDTGAQMWWRLAAGTTAEAPFFTQTSPWGGPDSGVASTTSTTTSTSGQVSSVSSLSDSSTTASALTAAPGADASCARTACGDSQPPSYTCGQQQSWGKCNEQWMVAGGWCAQTCGRCPCVSSATANVPTSSSPAAATPSTCTCSDIPPGSYSCANEVSWGHCSASFMQPTASLPEGFCQISCGRCACPTVAACACTDLQPPGARCVEHKSWGSCSQEWMWKAYNDRPRGYCQTTCGRCSC